MHFHFMTVPLLIILSAGTQADAETLYVDSRSAGQERTGKSWDKAYHTLQDALTEASFGDEIWVAAGRYIMPVSEPDGALVLQDNVSLYGGFSGRETRLSQRCWETCETIISYADGFTEQTAEDGYQVIMTPEGTLFNGFLFR